MARVDQAPDTVVLSPGARSSINAAPLYIVIAAEDDLTLPVVRLVTMARRFGLDPQVVPIEPNFSGFRILLSERRPAVFVVARSLNFAPETLGTLVQAFQLRAVDLQRLRIVSLDDEPTFLIRAMREDLMLIARRAEAAAAAFARASAKMSALAPTVRLPANPSSSSPAAGAVSPSSRRTPPRTRRRFGWRGAAAVAVAGIVGIASAALIDHFDLESARSLVANAAVSSAGVVGSSASLLPTSLPMPAPRSSRGKEEIVPPSLGGDASIVFEEEVVRVTRRDQGSPPARQRTPAGERGRCLTLGAEARSEHEWRAVLDALDRGLCWESQRDFLRLRIRALAELRQWEECVLVSATSDDAIVRQRARVCEESITHPNG